MADVEFVFFLQYLVQDIDVPAVYAVACQTFRPDVSLEWWVCCIPRYICN